MPQVVSDAIDDVPPGLDRLRALLLPALTLAMDLMPVARHPGAASGETARPGTGSLDPGAVGEAFAKFDPVLAAVHDIAVRAFQRMLDQLAGSACKLTAENKELAEVVMKRVDQFGLGLYFPLGGSLTRVRLGCINYSPSELPSYQGDAGRQRIAAGKFKLLAASEPGVGLKSSKGTQSATFPRLIVARSSEDAAARAAQRKEARLDIEAFLLD